jgi:UDP-N-acetylglucosamine:LPS N-acetylglucosamine transferase
VGGHLDEVMQLAPVLADHDVALVVNDECRLPSFPFRAVYRICHAERDWRVLVNLAEAARILHVEDPDVIVSTGAGPFVPFALLARALTHSRIVYVESAAAVTAPTLTGRLVYGLVDDFFYQWPELARHFDRGRLASIVFPSGEGR